MDKLCNSNGEAFVAFACSSSLTAEAERSLEETKRPGFFKNAYRNVREAYFDRGTI